MLEVDSYAEYPRRRFGERAELINGEVKMSAAPDAAYQSGFMYLSNVFYQVLKGKDYKVFAAPFDVRQQDAGKQNDGVSAHTVVQPVLCLICDPVQIESRGCTGVPELIVDFPGNTPKEMEGISDLYEETG